MGLVDQDDDLSSSPHLCIQRRRGAQGLLGSLLTWSVPLKARLTTHTCVSWATPAGMAEKAVPWPIHVKLGSVCPGGRKCGHWTYSPSALGEAVIGCTVLFPTLISSACREDRCSVSAHLIPENAPPLHTRPDSCQTGGDRWYLPDHSLWKMMPGNFL